MRLAKGACADGDVLDAHLVDLVHNHIYHIVTLTEVVMEGNGHAILDLALNQCLMDVLHDLASLRVHHGMSLRSCLSILVVIVSVSALECFLAGCL